MKIRSARKGAIAFFLLFVLAVIWPGMLPFNRIHPLVLGLPFSMAWIAGWVILAFLALTLLDRVESRGRGIEEGRIATELSEEGVSDALGDPQGRGTGGEES